MATTKITLRNPLGSVVFQETALSTTPVQLAGAAATYYHFELDNTSNTAVTYYKFYVSGAQAPDPTDNATHPRFVIPVPAATKSYLFVSTGLYQTTGNWAIATATLDSAGAQTAPANAVALTVLG